ncbi:MAG: DUF1269 domain-containing protein [Chloroflexia bacterium]|nr:DUF1269 domain-containing protein [Chloroflexia bacterium]
MTKKPLIAFIATYDDVAGARQDYDEVKQAHGKGFIREYDAAIIWKNDKGKIEIDSVSEEASRKWLLAGLGAGALIGLIFPPSILATSAIGALSGAVIGKFRDGLAQDDLEQIGAAMTGDNAALVVVAEDKVADALHSIGAKLDASNQQIEVVLSADAAVAAEQLQDAIAEASLQLDQLAKQDAERASQ